MFSARDQNVLSFSHLACYFLAIFSKVHEFVRKNVFSPISARFVIFAVATPLFSDFQQSARVCAKQHFQPEISIFCYFRTGRITFLRFSAKCTSLYKTAFSPQDQYVLSFSHWVQLFLAFFTKVHEFGQNSVLRTRSACFVIFGLGAPLFSDFQQSARVCTNSVFSPRSARFIILALGVPRFALFSKAD